MEIDPSQFLARNDDDDDDGHFDNDDDDELIPPPIMSMEEGPPILTSLGLTHINHVNSNSFLVCYFYVCSISIVYNLY